MAMVRRFAEVGLSAWELICHASLTGALQVSCHLRLSVSGHRVPVASRRLPAESGPHASTDVCRRQRRSLLSWLLGLPQIAACIQFAARVPGLASGLVLAVRPAVLGLGLQGQRRAACASRARPRTD
jgi:hypothetical protein